jgi:hypothetical protein
LAKKLGAQSAILRTTPFEQLPLAYGGSDLILLFRILIGMFPTILHAECDAVI